MVGLGDLAGGSFSSLASAANADGSVVVGRGSSASGTEAFRWTSGGGMVGLGDLAGGTFNSEANAVNLDGSVVVGRGTSASGTEAFLARVSSIGSGILDTQSLNNSLVASQELPVFSNALVSLAMHGAHHRPLMMYDNLGEEFCFWAISDGGYYGRDKDGYLLNQEVGGCHDFMDSKLRLGAGVGIGKSRQNTFLEGEQKLKGQYGLIEANYRPEDNALIFGLTGLAGLWEADVKRGYNNGGSPDRSEGETDVTSASLKASLHWQDAARVALAKNKNITLSPKIIYTHTHTEVDGFTETGGGFPIRFDGQTMNSNELRAGVEAQTKMNQDKTILRSTVEAVHRFDPDASGISGNLVGLFDFDVSDNKNSESWMRGGVEIEHHFDNNAIIGSSLFASTTGQDPDISGALNLRIPF